MRQQRPWIRIEVEPIGDLVIDERGARLPVNIKLTNVGALPATAVWTDIVAMPHTTIQDVIDDVPEPQRGVMCSSAVFPGSGHTVFPGETLTDATYVWLEREEVDSFKKPYLDLAIRACALYYDGSRNKPRHTDLTIVVSRGWHQDHPFLGFRSKADRADSSKLVISRPRSGNEAT